MAGVLCTTWTLLGLMGHKPWKPDEGYSFGLVLSLLHGKDWVVPMLAGEALAARSLGEGDPQRYVTLARYFAENISVQATSLERTVMDSAEAVNGADAVLLG